MLNNHDLDNKVKELQKDRDTTEWLVTIGSESAKINYLKHLAEYLLYRNISIKTLIENFEKDKKTQKTETKKVQEFINHLQERIAASSAANYNSAIKSRLKSEGIDFVTEIKIPDRHVHKNIEKETTPTSEQVNSLIRNAKP